MAEKRVRPRTGDIFSIKLADGNLGFGQISDQNPRERALCYFIAFDHRQSSDAEIDVARLSNASVLLVAHSLDALLHNHRWTITSNAPVQDGILYPAFTRHPAISGMKSVVDRWGAHRIEVPEPDARTLPLEWTIAPIAFEKALNAKFDLAPWEERFDIMIPQYDRSESRFFSSPAM